MHLSLLKAWLPMVASTIKNGNDRVRKGNSFPSHGLYSVFPVPLGQFILVTYPWRTGGKRLTSLLGPRDSKRFGRTE